jgi:ADP-dependent NAD(P)H-hydrate dehydratase / NAD(P)H-hydrate epimerase
MRPLVTPGQMAAADKAAISAGTPGEVLMDRAGKAVARAAIRLASGRYGKRFVVVCGKGNNGGDGFVAARELRRAGAAVRCLSVGDADEAKGDARVHLDRMQAAGVRLDDFDAALLEKSDVIVDAIFGTGFRGVAEGEPARAIDAINRTAIPVIAVDIPSGVAGDTGSVSGPAVEAQLTLAMAAEKVGTAVGAGAVHAGDVQVVDIGIEVGEWVATVPDSAEIASALPHRRPDAHKRSGGVVAVLAGSQGMTGAAVLSAHGATRMGAGYVTVGCTAAVDAVVAEQLPEVLSRIVTKDEILGAEALDEFAEVLERSGSLAIGPGLGRGPAQRSLVERTLAEIELPVVLDADGLNALGEDPSPLTSRTHPTVITPHPGELSGLTGASIADIQEDRLGAARDAAERFGCVVVLKGFRSVIARPGGRSVVNPTGGPELATAGTGDVLTGAIATLLASGMEPFEAAWAGVYVHGMAGDTAGRRLGPGGVLAGDVAEALPAALLALDRKGGKVSTARLI